ncbi:unnamed protein product [Schistocephalus solidus]|uniref:Uncharacterized protein n=1 Tax=Schistocephalus solidus TaxID=70667 RepID=A0A183S7D2_SCHSO|nr:unnamed protein product [Schistocephalus solidus]
MSCTLLLRINPPEDRAHLCSLFETYTQTSDGIKGRYIRSFINLFRLLQLEMASHEEESLDTEHICELVNAWQSIPRAQRTNATWINRVRYSPLPASKSSNLIFTSIGTTDWVAAAPRMTPIHFFMKWFISDFYQLRL